MYISKEALRPFSLSTLVMQLIKWAWCMIPNNLLEYIILMIIVLTLKNAYNSLFRWNMYQYWLQNLSAKFILKSLTINLLNLLIGLVHLSFLEQSIINFRDIKMRNWSLSANNIEPCKTARTCRFAWLYILVAKVNHFWFQQGKC